MFKLPSIPTLILSVFLLSSLPLTAQFTPGQTYFGSNNYTEYHAGNLPIIISAPHGGVLKPASIPDRSCAGCVTASDSNTEILAYDIDSAIQVLFGGYPHIITNKLARIKLDANREIVEAALGNAQAEAAWLDYHNFIQAAKNAAVADFGSAIYIDLHGHGHSIQRLELGYLISKSDLQSTDAILDAGNFQNSSGIRHLKNVLNPTASFADIMRGNECIGEFMVERGYPTTPSASDPAPAPGDSYFSGGYNTIRHGSRDSSTINGIQFELNMTGVRDTDPNRKAFARSLACAIRSYLDHWFFDLDSWDPGNIVTTLSDNGPGSLRQALLGAENGDIITFSNSLNGDTIRLKNELRICSSVTLKGPGQNLLAVSGGDSVRIIRVMPGDSLSIHGLSLVRGRSHSGEDGGAILVEGTLSLINCKIAENFADDDGGAISLGATNILWLDSCLVENNSCGDDGGALRNLNGNIYINASTIRNNYSPSYGGGISSNGIVSISNSTFSDNEADVHGGAIRSFAGNLTCVNSTFSGNIAGNRGAAISTSADANLNFCTLADNQSANPGAALRITGGNFTLSNTLIALNSAPSEPDISVNGGAILSNGYNFISDTTGSNWTSAIQDQTGNAANPIDPIVQPLAANGGITETVALLTTSPCLDQANAAGAPATDQRGWQRIYAGQPDIGAFEFQIPLHLIEESSILTGEPNSTFTLFPNPATNLLNLKFSKEGNFRIDIGNLLGQVFIETKITSGQTENINISELPNGTYWLRVRGDVFLQKTFIVRRD